VRRYCLRCVYILCFTVVSVVLPSDAQATTGYISVASPAQPFVAAKSFLVSGQFSMTSDTATSGNSIGVPSYCMDKGISNMPGVGFPIYVSSAWNNVHAYVQYQIDNQPVKTLAGIYSDSVGNTMIGEVRSFAFSVDISNMAEGTTHSISIYMVDWYGIRCNRSGKSWFAGFKGNTFVRETITFKIADSKPSISIALDKQSYVPCEGQQATINVTSNDPTPNGGTVTLTLPDGTTASASFAGKGAALTLADFGLPTAYLGAFQAGDISRWDASVTTAAGKTASATASANIMAGGLTIQMTPDTAMIEPQLRDRDILGNKKIQQLNARTQDIQIKVLDSSGAAVLGAQVNASFELFPGAETFGGHDHGVTGRPISTLGSLTPIKEINGTYNTTYSSSIYASKAQIRVTATDPATQCTAKLVSKPFIAQVSGLVQWNTALGINRLVGGTCNHYGPADSGTTCTSPNNNHYLTQASINKLIKLQQAYMKKYPNRGGLRINDASLPKGGAFEATTRGLWVNEAQLTQKGFGHITHRRGLDVDIGNRDTYDIPGKPPYTVTKKALDALNTDSPARLFKYIKDESTTAAHLHVYFE